MACVAATMKSSSAMSSPSNSSESITEAIIPLQITLCAVKDGGGQEYSLNLTIPVRNGGASAGEIDRGNRNWVVPWYP